MKYPRLPETKDLRKKMLLKHVALMLKMKKQGVKHKQLAKHFKVSDSTIDYWLYPYLRERKRIRNDDPEKKKASTRKTVARKRKIQPEYNKYNYFLSNLYYKTEKGKKARWAYRKRNIEKMRLKEKENYYKHREKKLAQKRKYYLKNMKIISEHKRIKRYRRDG